MTDETKTKTTPDALSSRLSAVSHKKNFIIIKRKKGIVLEFEDVLFHHDSAVLLPAAPKGPSSTQGSEDKEQKELTGLEVIRAIYIFCQENPLQRLVIAGHTDTSGPTKYNFDLSKLRSQAVQYVLLGNRFGWQGVVNKKNKVEDYQQILTHYAKRYTWDCDPGGITGSNNKQTKDAVENFQKTYNLEFEKTISEDGIVGEQTWGAIFDVYMKELTELMGEDKVGDLQQWRDQVKFVDAMKKIVPCGESIPIDSPGMDGLKSQTNRRIEFVFFHQDDPPVLNCPPSGDTLHPRETCPLYNDWVKREYIDPATLELLGPAVSIDALDKWFLPGPTDADGETCNIKYTLSGGGGFANKVVMEVYGSNYSEASVKTDGSITFTELKGAVPVYSQNQPADKSRPGSQYNITEWHGQSKAAKGILKPRTGEERYINVAFSPYTVHLRYFKNDADKDARIVLEDFWPRWEKKSGTETVKSDSLKIKWKIEKTKKLKYAKLLIFDKDDDIVFEKELSESDVTEGDHHFTWDGGLKDGSTLSKSEMPYRVQLQAHSDGAEKNGVALAAMHTEVRLFVHKDTGKHKQKESHKDPNTMIFSPATIAPKVPDENSEEDAWYQFQLAAGGFHPGPITGTFDNDTKIALREFQRSFPKNDKKPFARLNPSGNKDADTKAALKRLPADTRPEYGNPDDRTDFSSSDAHTRLNDNKKDIIAWVDDRHYYTQDDPSKIMFLNDYHGDMSIGDDRVDKDKEAITRPSLPLCVELPLLPKDSAHLGLKQSDFVLSPITRRAIGPLRVDWSFMELEQDLSVIDTGHSDYKKKRTRSRRWVDEVTKALGDEQDGQTFRNAPDEVQIKTKTVTLGGLRPVDKSTKKTDVETYLTRVFGHDDKSLMPWRAVVDKKTKSLCTIVYDDLQQAKESLSPDHFGQSGMYFHPSRIAGDGYRLRTQVSFEVLAGGAGQFPNREVLARRYDKAPQAHTSGLRLWRKTSYRGYSCWAPPKLSHWPDLCAPSAELYKGAHLHFIHENDDPTKPRDEIPLGPVGDDKALIKEEKVYTGTVKTHSKEPFKSKKITFNIEYVWPHLDEPHYGVPRSKPHGKKKGKRALDLFYDKVFDPMFNKTWRRFRKPLLHKLLEQVETKYGLFKGHYLVEFKASPKITIQEYECSKCKTTRAEVLTKTDTDTLENKDCPKCVGGKFQKSNKQTRSNIPLPAVGVSMGSTWLFTSGGADVWAHEMGHHRHLQHAVANISFKNGKKTPKEKEAPGGQPDQHDHETNPAFKGKKGENKNSRGWDRCCIMSYNFTEPLFFCGKCLMKNRGWAVEKIENPDGSKKD